MEFEPKRESAAGYHFLHLYQLCARKFFIRYILGVAPRWKAEPLLLGGSIHDAVAAFYLGASQGNCLKGLENALESEAEGLEHPDRVDLLIVKAQAMFRNWVQECGAPDKKNYRVLGVELSMSPQLPNGYVTTVRCDAVLGSKEGDEAFLVELKTTGWNAELTYNGLEMSEQVTSYLYALRQLYPEWRVSSCLPTIIYGRQSQIHTHRFDLIYRTPADLFDFETQTMMLMAEITQKVKALNDYPWIGLFPRDTQWCTSYYRPCEYFHICRQQLSSVCPPGFVKEPWSDFDALLNLNYDLLDLVEVEVVDD